MDAEYARCCALWSEATAVRARQAKRQADLPAMELHAALSSMSPDTDVAARVIVLAAGGEVAGVTCLSAADVERLRLAAEDGAAMHAVDADGLLAEAEAFLRGNEGGDPWSTS
ncbi:hypothetical protein [Streptomyces violascens]|uniref:hypothetical protein n=1 Tax=Streptomyces violascens TaxID=67381 RepID=UPI0036B87A86